MMKIDKANTLLFFDLVENTLKFSENPGELGKYLTNNIRELIGCRAVILHYFIQNEIKLLEVCPPRKIEFAKGDKLISFSKACKLLNQSEIINNETKNTEIRNAFLELEVNESIYIPLLIGNESIGALIIHDLLTEIGNPAVLKSLQSLSGVIALTLKNALSFQLLEEKVELRTKELKEKNEEYEALNEEYKAQNEDLLKAKDKAEESDKLKTSFLQNMSHEIRTPMNAISGFSGFLTNPKLSEEKKTTYVTIIQNSCTQLLSIVTDILTISALETNQEKLAIQKVCVNSVILELVSIFKVQANKKNISLYSKQHLTDLQSEIYTDQVKLVQILNNLLANALKFTHIGKVEFGYNLMDNKLEFYVKDTGIGIDSKYHTKIFERFTQANDSSKRLYGGTGLGLSISKAFVELLGGKIWVQSELEKGSSFYFTIPYKPVNEISETISDTNNNKRIILVAEDDEYNFLVIEEFLIDMDFILIHSKNGLETVDICKTNPNIDLVLMDIKMPIMNGYHAAKLIKEFRLHLPIVAQTAYALEQDIEKYQNIFDDYITKPINEDELKQKILQFINNK